MFHPAIHLNVASGSFSESRTANSRKSKQSENIGKKISPWREKFLTELLTRIYTAFILGKALQNFGTRANSFGHGPLDLHDKICLSFFNVDFWNGTPETRTALLNLWVPALIWQRFTCDFKRVSGMSGALLRAVRKKRKSLQILECKMQLYGSLLWKVKTSVTIVGWNKVIPCTAPYMHQSIKLFRAV